MRQNELIVKHIKKCVLVVLFCVKYAFVYLQNAYKKQEAR